MPCVLSSHTPIQVSIRAIHRQNVLPHKLAGIISHLPVRHPSPDIIRAEFRKIVVIF